MNHPQTRNTLNNINLRNVESVEGFDRVQRPHLAGLGQPKNSVIIVQEGPPDSKSQKESSKLEKQTPEQAALVNSQFISMPVESSQINVGNGFPPSPQPVTHSQLQQYNNPTYINNSVVQSTSIALRQLAKTVSQPLGRPPLPPSNLPRNLQTAQNSQQSLNKIQTQNRLSPPSRPSSSVPTVVHFNYQFSQKQPTPPPQIQIVTFPTQNIQPVVFPPPIPPKNIVQADRHNQQLINENNQLHQQILLWQQRYFTVIQRFHFCYQRIETITRQYIIIHEKVQNCTDPHQLQALKERMASLEQIISQTEQELVQIVNRNKQVVGDNTNWKAKYEQLVKKYSHQRTPQLHSQLEALESHLSEVETDYQRVLALNEQAHQNQRQYIDEINRLNELLSQQGTHDINYSDEIKKYRDHLLMKEDQINTLRMLVEAQKSDMNNQPSQRHGGLVQRLTQQKNELYNALKQIQSELTSTKNAYEQKIAEYEYQLKTSTQEIRRFQMIIEQKGKADSMKKSQTLSNNQLAHDKDHEILRLKHELDIKEETQIAERKMFNSKIQELTSTKDSTIAILQEKASILESDLNKKDSLIRSLRDKVYELEESLRIRNLDDKYQKGSGGSITNAVKSIQVHSGESHQNDKELHNLRTKLKEQNLKLEQVKGQVSEYKRLSLESQDALTAAKHENAMLKKQVDDLNYKLSQLKETIRELQQGRKTYHQLKVYSDSLKQTLHQKEKEILMLNHRIEDIELMQKQTTRIKPPQLAQLAQFTQITQQNQMLQASIYKKDLQISKLKQNNQLLQNTYDQLEAEYQKISQKKVHNDKQYENEKNQLKNERNELKNKISVLQGKAMDYESKVASLEEVRAILQQQLTALTSELQVKIENLQRSEIDLKQEKAKNKTFQSEIQTKMSQAEELKIKIKEAEKKNNNLVKEVQLELEKKNQELNSRKSQSMNLQTKLFDLQTILKTKDARIKELQKNNENLKLKMGNLDSNLDQLKYLKNKIGEYESKVSALTYKTASRLPNTEPTQIFERKVIYQLKLENEALKQQLNLVNRPTNDSQNDPLPKKELKQRLTDFNQRLEEVIGQHFNGDLAAHSQNDLFKKYQRDRRQLIEKYNQEITQLKLKILQLQSQQPTEYKVTYSKGHYSPESIYNEQIQFYRQKNIELEGRVDSHIKVNKDLKEQIQRLMRGHQDEYSITYYTQQLEKSNELNAILQQKIKKANLQIKKLRDQLSKSNARPIDSSDFEIRISEMNRKISQFVQEINELDREKAELNQQVVSLQQDLQRSKTVQDELRVSREEISRQLQQKQEEMQNETIKLNSRIKLLQTQIDRLNEVITKRQNTQSSELNLLKLKLNDSQQENRKLKVRIEDYLLIQQRNQREITRWQTQFQSIQIEMQRYKEQTEVANRRFKEAETQIYNLRSSISDYQGKLRSKESMFEDHSYLQNQLNQEIARLKSQCALLSQELERVNEFAQKRISQKETEVFRVRQTVTQKQQQIYSLEEQVNQFKISLLKANQTNQQVAPLQDEINRLNYSLIVKNSDYERREQEINDLNARIRLAEEQIRQLRKTAQVKAGEFSAIISRLQLQLKTSNEKQQRLREIEWQYQQFRSQHKAQLQSLRATISQYQTQLQHRQQLIMQAQSKTKHIEFELTEIIRKKETQINELHVRLSQFQVQVERMQTDVKQMHKMMAHIQNLEAEIDKMHKYIAEQQQFYSAELDKTKNQGHMSTTQRQTYEATIQKLEGTIYQLNLQINELTVQLDSIELQRTQLLSIRSSLQINISSLQQTISTLELQITNLHQTISVREKEYLQLNTKYQEHVSQMQIELQNYRLVITQLEQRLTSTDQQFNALIRNSQYSIELMRSIFLSVQTQLHQKECVHESVYFQLSKGLQQCQKWNEIGV